MINIEVVYTEPERQWLIAVSLEAGYTVLQAIQASGILKLIGLSPDSLKGRVGIYGKLVTLETCVQNDDRIEIYRPLMNDPKVARREKARHFLRKKVSEIREKKLLRS